MFTSCLFAISLAVVPSMLFEATVWGERVSFPSCHMMKWHEKCVAPFLSRTLIWKKLAIIKQQNANQTLPMGTTAAGSWYCSAGIGNPQWLPGSGKEIGKLYNYRFFIYLLWIISSVRSSNSHPDLLLIHPPPPTFSDHTGPQHWTFTFWATTAI